MSSHAIAASLGTNPTRVKRWLKRYGIKMRPMGRGLANKEMPQPTREELEQYAHRDLLSCKEIGSIYGVSQTMASKWLQFHGITRPRRWEIRHKEKFPELPPVSDLVSMYDTGLSAETIAAQFGVERGMIVKIMSESGVNFRRRGWGERDQYVCDDGTIVRSSYEMRVANWIIARGLEYTYEPRIPFHKKWAADFYCSGWYVEIWGVNNSPKYQARKAEKLKGYQLNNVPLVQLHDGNFAARQNDWEKKLLALLNPPVRALSFL